jgi:hypothetical protein
MYRHQTHALGLALTSYFGDIEGLVILLLHFHCLDSRVKAFDDGKHVHSGKNGFAK